jgi:hypothetical protein
MTKDFISLYILYLSILNYVYTILPLYYTMTPTLPHRGSGSWRPRRWAPPGARPGPGWRPACWGPTRWRPCPRLRRP